MVIDDLHRLSVLVIRPPETKTPLVIHPNAPLAFPVSFKRFQTVGRRHSQVLQGGSVVQQTELSPRHILDVGWEAATADALPNKLCFRA
jgi:hypothetical protein